MKSNDFKVKYDPALLRRVAVGFAVDEDLLRSALARQQQPPQVFFKRTDELLRGLEHELGGEDAVRVWLRTENGGLDGMRPVQLLEEGRLDVLERVQKALKGLQFG